MVKRFSATFMAIASAGFLAGCETPARPGNADVGYDKPSAATAAPTDFVVNLPIDVAKTTIARAEQHVPGLWVTYHPEATAFVATYSGNAAPFVDCGTLHYTRNGKAVDVAGTAGSSKFPDSSGREVERKVSLDARSVVRLTPGPLSDQTKVAANTTYVVTRRFEYGDATPPSVTTLAFDGATRGTAPNGFVCAATGRFERALLGQT